MDKFKVFRIHQDHGRVAGRIEAMGLEDLSPGEVVIRAAYSSVNYKDALAATGAGPIITRFPRVGGIDVSGHVEHSAVPHFKAGDAVLVTGYDLGVAQDGGYAEVARVPAEWVIPLPAGMTLREAMALGSAGFTVALCVKRLEDNGQHPAQGPIVVTGASGGVGSLAVDILSGLGYSVIAVTGKVAAQAYLRDLGASTVLDQRAIDPGSRPLEKGQWAGAIDNVGGALLGWLTRTMQPGGNICSVGLTGGSELNTTVMPFILRGVGLLGITSAGCPSAIRRALWPRLAAELRPRHLDKIVTREVDLEGLPAVFAQMLRGEAQGRTLVRIGADT
ncbi:MAG: oxidoreductase [Gammaproteobacteria bacterium]